MYNDKLVYKVVILAFFGISLWTEKVALSTEAMISTQLSMTSHGENEAMYATTFNLFTKQFVEFENCFCSKTHHFTGHLCTNSIKHVSEMKL